MDKILEMFNQVKINVSLLDIIQQVPSYAKFLRNMCTKKKKTNAPKKVFLATNISELLSGPIPVKYKDPGCPTIACIIGQIKISRALLDLRASINLLPFSVYQQLGLAELSLPESPSNSLTGQLKFPRGKLLISLSRSGCLSTPLISLFLRHNVCPILGLKLLLS